MPQPSPKVSVIICTYNRPQYLGDTLDSVLKQEMTDFEILIINDGGEDVWPVISQFNDSRIHYHNRKENRGKAACCNFGLKKAQGQYIAYIDDDDIWYPNHLALLSKALDENPQYGVAYSDLYAVSCFNDPYLKKRHVLDKKIMVSREFNRDFMFYFNHVLHVSMMHRKEAAFRVGLYDESVTVLIEWSLGRKLCMVYDFFYVPLPTGEYYMPVFKSDRISVVQRKDKERYRMNTRKIRTSFPPPPWPKIDTVEILVPVNYWDDSAKEKLGQIVDHIDHPVHITMINNGSGLSEDQCRDRLGALGTLSNLRFVHSKTMRSTLEAFRFAAAKSKAEYVFLLTKNAQIDKVQKRIITGLEYLKRYNCEGIKWDLKEEAESYFDIMMNRKKFLERSDFRKRQKSLDIRCLANVVPTTFQFDVLFAKAKRMASKGQYKEAADAVQEILKIDQGKPGMQFLSNLNTGLLIELKDLETAEKELKRLIAIGYAPDNWVRLGIVLQAAKRFEEAADAFRKGLAAFKLTDEDLDSPAFPIPFPKELASFNALMGLGDCLEALGDKEKAFRMYHSASKLRANSHRPFLRFVKHFLDSNQLDRAEAVAKELSSRGAKNDPETHRVLGKLCTRRGQLDVAFTCYQNAVVKGQYAEQDIEPLYHTGKALKKWPELTEILEEYQKRIPNHPSILAKLADLNFQTGNFREALRIATQGLEIAPTNVVFKGVRQKSEKMLAQCQDQAWPTAAPQSPSGVSPLPGSLVPLGIQAGN